MNAIPTLSDIVDHLVDIIGGNSDAKGFRKLKRAALAAHRDVLSQCGSDYYVREHQLLTSAGITGGSIVYTHATRTCVLTDYALIAAEQAIMTSCKIRIGTVVCDVEALTAGDTDTTFTLTKESNPGEDIASTTTWNAWQTTYALPSDFNGMIQALSLDDTRIMRYIEPQDIHQLERREYYSGEPAVWTIVRSLHEGSTWSIKVIGVPSDQDVIAFLYRGTMLTPSLSGYETKASVGTVTLDNTTTIAGSGTSFDASMVGSRIRVSGVSGTAPTNFDGDNPFIYESKITAVASTTSLTVATAPAATLDGATQTYMVSSPIMIDPMYLNAMYAGAEYHIARTSNDVKKVESKYAIFMDALRVAMESNSKGPNRYPIYSGQTTGYPYGLGTSSQINLIEAE